MQKPETWFDKQGYNSDGMQLLSDILGGKVLAHPKPVSLIEYIIKFATDPNTIVLDSFAGSGTTAHAVLNLNKQDSGNRKFILVEMEDYAESITAERVRRVINGYGEQEGTGGSFDFYELGENLFAPDGNLNESVGVEKIRQYVWYSETSSPLPLSKMERGVRQDGVRSYLGTHNQTAYYFYYEPDSITTLDHAFLASLQTKAGQYVIYADNCLLTKEFMVKQHIIFKKIPRDISKL
jgi:adenine-specific DNA-methyltransferase